MNPDVVSNWIAIIALLFSAIALAVSIYNVLLNRPRLRIDAANDIFVFWEWENREGPYLKVTITNTGTQPTTVTSIGLTSSNHAWAPKFTPDGKTAVLNGGGHSAKLPKALGPGEYLDFFANESDDLHDNFLQRAACYAVVWHSWGSKPKLKRIRLTKKL
ncbi:MAG: hypothetical protein AAFV59_07775 [Pseudomonadota bacterium]